MACLCALVQVKKDRTHFKRPKAGNQRLVVPVGDEFVIDVNLFELDRVHRAQAAAGQNICIKTVQEGRCGGVARGWGHAG